MKFRVLVFAGLSVIFFSCSSVQRTFPLSEIENQELKEDVVTYSLPKNAIRLQFKMNEVHKIPGSFAVYSKEMIGVEPDILVESWDYQLKARAILLETLPDANQNYLVEHSKKSIAGKPVFNENGLLIGFNVPLEESKRNGAFSVRSEEVTLDLRRDSRYYVKGIGERIDTTYRIIRHDSLGVIQQPVLKKQSVVKSEKEKAADLAGIMLDLQQEKLRVLQGDKHELPDGKAFEVVFNEFKSIEEKYLPLFYGTTEESSRILEFSLIPEPELLDSTIILGYFSEKTGFRNEAFDQSTPLSISFTMLSKHEKSEILRHQMDSIAGQEEILYLRQPAQVLVCIKLGEQTLEEYLIMVAQLGSIYRYPIGDLNPRKSAIYLNPEYGSFQGLGKRR